MVHRSRPPDNPTPPAGDNGTQPLTRKQIIAAMKRLPEAERIKLFRSLDDADAAWLLGYAMTPLCVLDAARHILEALGAMTRLKNEINRALRAARAVLDRSHRPTKEVRNAEVVQLHQQGGLTFGQIARRMGTTYKHVQQIYRRATKTR